MRRELKQLLVDLFERVPFSRVARSNKPIKWLKYLTMSNNTQINSGLETINSPKFDISIFEVKNGKINLTKICQSFGKDIREWKRLPSTVAFLNAYQGVGKSHIITVTGKGKEQGTFGNREIALKLAQWISPEFEVFCIQKLDELFQTGKTELKKQTPLELLKFAVAELEAKEKENQKLALENTTLASRDLEVKTQKEYKWKSQELQNDRGRTINYYVNKHFFTGDYREAHNRAKAAFRNATGVNLPDNAKSMSMEQKKEYLDWLSRI
jgi:hypothetical protein